MLCGDQQPQHRPGAGGRSRIAGPALDLLNGLPQVDAGEVLSALRPRGFWVPLASIAVSPEKRSPLFNLVQGALVIRSLTK